MNISIITVCYNDLKGLKRTIASVDRLSYSDRELIVVDGLSNDGSQEYIENSLVIDKNIIEKDTGIYNAMNKGVRLATGDFVLFMNAGDTFASKDAINFIESSCLSGADLIYGDVFIDELSPDHLEKARALNGLWKGMVFSHQSLLTRRTLLLELPFDEGKKIAADYNFILASFMANRVMKYVNVAIACVESGGISKQQQLLSTKERFNALSDNGLCTWKVFLFYNSLFIKIRLKSIIKWILRKKV